MTSFCYCSGAGGRAMWARVRLRPVYFLVPLLMRAFPSAFTTSEILGRAMLRVTQGRADRFILEPADINRVGR